MRAGSGRRTRGCSSSDDGQAFGGDARRQAAFLRVAEQVCGPGGEPAVAESFPSAIDAECGAGVVTRALGPPGVLRERDPERRPDRVLDPFPQRRLLERGERELCLLAEYVVPEAQVVDQQLGLRPARAGVT